MSINPRQLRELVVRPTLIGLGFHSQEAEDLVIGTAAQESRFKYRRQLGGGPALGFWQMEPATYEDHRVWLSRRRDLRAKILDVCVLGDFSDLPPAEAMVWNSPFGAAMCRIHYLRKRGAIPTTLAGQAAYWKAHYNTPLGAGTVEEYVRNYGLVA